MAWRLRPLTPADARAIAGWEYQADLAFYNVEGNPTGIDSEHGFVAVVDAADDLVGFLSFGPDGQVPGGDYQDAGQVDIGAGLRPDLVHRGRSDELLELMRHEVAARFPGQRIRATVTNWNGPALAVVERAGMRRVTSFRRPDGVGFVIFEGPPPNA